MIFSVVYLCFRHFENVHGIFKPDGKVLKGFSSHDGVKYAPEFFYPNENVPEKFEKRNDSSSPSPVFVNRKRPRTIDSPVDTNASDSNMDINESDHTEVATAAASLDHVSLNAQSSESLPIDDGCKTPIEDNKTHINEAGADDDLNDEQMIEVLNKEYNEVMNIDDGMEELISVKVNRNLIDEFDDCTTEFNDSNEKVAEKGLF